MNKLMLRLCQFAVVGVAAMTIAWSQIAWSQAAGRGTVTGTVINGSDAVVSGVKVVITSSVSSGYTENATTDANGAFTFSHTPIGGITLSVYDQAGKRLGSAQASVGFVGQVVTVTVKVP